MHESDSTLTIDQILATRSWVAADLPQWWAGSQVDPPRDFGGGDSSRAHGGAEGVAPSASQVAFVSGLGGETDMWSVDAGGGFPLRLTEGMGGVRFLGTRIPRVSPDGRWIAYLSERTGAAEIWLWPTNGGSIRRLTHLGNNINSVSWAPDSQSVVLDCNRYGAFDIYHVSVPDGKTTRLTQRALYEVYPVFMPDGQNIVYVRLDEHWVDHEVVMIPATGGEERVIACDKRFFDYHYGRTFGHPLIAPDGKSLLFRSHRSGWINYWRVPIAGGEPKPLCAEEADQSDAVWSPDGKSVALCSNHNGTISLQIVDAGSGSARALVAPGMGMCALPQWSPDSTRVAYLAQTPTAPLDLWVVSVKDGAARQLTQSMLGGGAERRLISPEKIAYKSFDGLTINAYLYKPHLKPGEKAPGILWIHGGPTSQYSDTYAPNMQFFAQQGYAVLAPNIRGSSGYGRHFEDLNDGDWGHDDLRDVIAGVEYLKRLDYVNPQAMGITGTSYGGCMSMSAVCFAPGVFQAAIPASGYADWVAMYDEQELRHVKLLEYEFGPIETHKHIYRKCSPYYAVKQATTPTLVIHGEGGLPRSSASADFVKAMEKEYKTVRYKTYPHEGYYVGSLANTRQMWLDMLDFFDEFLKK
jgi:dipeptidyl aminopeptidase/acylaminoacyl peptidase